MKTLDGLHRTLLEHREDLVKIAPDSNRSEVRRAREVLASRS